MLLAARLLPGQQSQRQAGLPPASACLRGEPPPQWWLERCDTGVECFLQRSLTVQRRGVSAEGATNGKPLVEPDCAGEGGRGGGYGGRGGGGYGGGDEVGGGVGPAGAAG